MGRKSCKKQQKWRQQQQLPPGDVGPSYMVDEWCPGCGEFGHTVAICLTQYQGEEWGLEVGEVGHLSPDYNHSPPQEEVGLEPQPQEENGWETLLRSMGVQYSCCICGELGHFPANCPLPPVRDLLCPPTPAEGEFLLVPAPPPTAGAEQQELSLSPPQSPAEGECLLVPPSPAEGEFLLVPPPPAEGACLLVPPPSPPPAEGACGAFSSKLPPPSSERPAVPTNTSRGRVPAGSSTTSNGRSRAGRIFQTILQNNYLAIRCSRAAQTPTFYMN
ncbi:UNVERIFIED_CONTAM: hypothetical protein FKN15_071069 [Acipenser sinensis]